MQRTTRQSRLCVRGILVLSVSITISMLSGGAQADGGAPQSLKHVDVPEIKHLDRYLAQNKKGKKGKNGKKDHASESDLELLGKALFWDQAVGSDGVACASCHYHAGADSRVKNQLNPGQLRVDSNGNPYPDDTFQRTASGGMGGPNYTLVDKDFPFHQFNNPNNRRSGVKFSSNDVGSSQGTFGGGFLEVPLDGQSINDICSQFADPVFHVGQIGVRKVEPRNTPTMINAVFNFRNFWDGRANNTFNGVDPFGLRNGEAFIYNNKGKRERVRLENSSLASQAVGPPTSDFEMICSGRTFAEMGRKLLSRRALASQRVHKDDSVLGKKRDKSGYGLKYTYAELIEKTFDKKYWDSRKTVDGYSLMEINFSLFWGIAVQAYQATLISDKAPYDKFAGKHKEPFELSEVKGKDRKKLTEAELNGLKIFLDKGKCINCHKGPEFSGAASVLQSEYKENGLVERMIMGNGSVAMYDNGFYNIGVTPTEEDLGVGGVDPWGNPLSFTRQFTSGKFVDRFKVDTCTFEVPFRAKKCKFVPGPRRLAKQQVAVDGAFKVPTLRNVELTGPYMHNGSMSTLEQVVEFYNRGGNFKNTELDPDIRPLGLTSWEQADLVAFLKTLTDPRVANEEKPFDHPELRIPNGHPGDENQTTGEILADDDWIIIPAVGKRGRKHEGLAPLKPFSP